MNCLNCGQQMVNYTVLTREDRVSYDVCEACGSLWLDAGELDKMAFQVEGSVEFCSDEEVGEVGRPCPRCPGEPLAQVRFLGAGDVVLEKCPNCGGFWLDGGKLDLVNRELENVMPVEGRGFSDFVNNLHLPYWHKRIRRDSAETDFEVEAPPLKHARRTGRTQMVCPACEAQMGRYEAYGTPLVGCDECKGVWLDVEELRELKDRATRGTWRALNWMDDELEEIESAHAIRSERVCPQCEDERLLSTVFGESAVIVDWCPSCRGVWLDRREFEGIVEYLQAELDELSPEELRARLVQELKDVWGGPEGPLAELRDVRTAAGALINLTIFRHPRLFRWLMSLPRTGIE